MAAALLDQIEQDALDSTTNLADALRKCIALGSRAGSEELRGWARRELDGYVGAGDRVPEYRKVVAPIVIDAFTQGGRIERQPVTVFDLPDVVRKSGITEELTLRDGVGTLETMKADGFAKHEAIRLGLPESPIIAKLMNDHLRGTGQYVERVYWNVSPIAIDGVLDQIRTRLVDLVAEIRATEGNTATPSAEAVENAVHVVVYGDKSRVNVRAAQAGGTTTTVAPQAERSWWRTAQGIGVIGVATVALAVFAWLEWAG